jgi:c-di-GMP-binding flagellar brake protein YcgR
MVEISDFNINRRGKFRVKTRLNAQYFIKKQSSRYVDCQIVNLSRTGAAVSLPPTEQLKCGDLMFIDIFIPKTLLHASTQAEIKRVETREKELVCGVKFTELISQALFEQLTK